ncbi:MAG: molybdopterin-dependent oxidoreductase [Burkholderiales bacterium]
MDTSRRHHRHWLLATALVGALLHLAPALALDAAKGPVLLSVTGAVANTNDAGVASFDMALLTTLPQHSFSTKTPWYPKPRKFTGVLVRDLLDTVGAKGSTTRAVALNDYRADMPTDDLVKHGAMIAYLLDDEPMPVREKGPLVIIFPFSDRPELRTAVHYSRAVWQLKSLELR